MRNIILSLLFLITFVAITGCSSEESEIDDSQYGFVKYMTSDGLVYTAEELSKVRDELLEEEESFKGWVELNVVGAFDEESRFYSYIFNAPNENIKDDGDDLAVQMVFPENEQIEHMFTMEEGNTYYLVMKSGNMYKGGIDDLFNIQYMDKIMENVDTEAIRYVYDGSEAESVEIEGGDSSLMLPIAKNVSVLTNEGKLYIWGANDVGQLGNGSLDYESRPQLILENVEHYEIDSSAYYKGAALMKDYKLYAWGKLPGIKETHTFSSNPSGIANPNDAIMDMTFQDEIEVTNPNQKGYYPINLLENADSFTLAEDGIIAETADGEVTLN